MTLVKDGLDPGHSLSQMHCAQQKKQFPLILDRGSQSYLSWFIVYLAYGAHPCASACPSLPESGWARAHLCLMVPAPMADISKNAQILIGYVGRLCGGLA